MPAQFSRGQHKKRDKIHPQYHYNNGYRIFPMTTGGHDLDEGNN